MSKEKLVIQFTEDYSRFKFLHGNRDISEKHVVEISDKIEEREFPIPIIINEKDEILDGQHTFVARKRLKREIPYVVIKGMNLSDCQSINQNRKNWNNNDFCQSFIKQGNTNYDIYQSFIKRYKIPHFVAIQILHIGYCKENDGGDTNLKKIFQSGQLKIKNIRAAEKFAEQLERVAPYFKGYNNSRFVLAFFTVATKKQFQLDRFISKLKARPNALYQCARAEQFIALIEEIYNYRSSDKVNLRFGK